MKRISGFGILMCTVMAVSAGTAQAGFEFLPPAPPQQAQAAQEDIDPAMMASLTGEMAPMPILPPGEVSAEPLPSMTPMNVAPAAVPAAEADPVYVRRQRMAATITPAANEPINTQALLKATARGDAVALTPQALEAKPAPQQSAALLINPYPLNGEAVHNPTMGTVPLEQAMMEEGGALRPVALPGSDRATGQKARAQITARLKNESHYLAAEDHMAMTDPALTGSGMGSHVASGGIGNISMTPIPGGEGPSLGRVDSVPLAPLPPPTGVAPRVSRAEAMPRPAIPQGYPQPAQAAAAMPAFAPPSQNGSYADAVGFGRDLPLALALSQVVPPEYSYAFATNVNVGTTVSWQGGRPWNTVLDEMLAPSGMRAIIHDGQVTIVTI